MVFRVPSSTLVSTKHRYLPALRLQTNFLDFKPLLVLSKSQFHWRHEIMLDVRLCQACAAGIPPFSAEMPSVKLSPLGYTIFQSGAESSLGVQRDHEPALSTSLLPAWTMLLVHTKLLWRDSWGNGQHQLCLISPIISYIIWSHLSCGQTKLKVPYYPYFP